MNPKRLITLIFLIMALVPAAGCMIYHKPAFQGKVIDVETKEPLEGAVVVAIYNKEAMGIGAGANTEIINVREALTNSDGKFRISSYTTLIAPIVNRESSATFIIFKPSYASVSRLNLEDYLSKENGKETEIQLLYSTAKIRLSPGIVEIPKLKTRAEIKKRMLGFPTGFGAKELPLLYKAYEEEKILFDR